jgi:hypothetical protein
MEMFIFIYYSPHEGSCSQHVLRIRRPKCSNREDSPLYEFGHEVSIFPCLDHISVVRGDVHPGVLMLFQIVEVYMTIRQMWQACCRKALYRP